MTEISALAVADPASLWEELGFVVSDDASWVSGIRHQLGATGEGVVAWALGDATGLTELPTIDGPPDEVQPTPPHPNGVIALDHIVIATPDLGRTTAAFEAAGIPLRRTRDVGDGDRAMQQAFFKLGQVVAEVVGTPTRTGPGPATFYGLAYTVADLDATADYLGDRLRPARDAVQSGRRIATLDWSAGSTVSVAFMSARP